MREGLVIEGREAAARRVQAVGTRAERQQIRKAIYNKQTRDDLKESAKRQFERGNLKPASPEWVREKRMEGLDTRTMRASNRLYNLITRRTTGKVRVSVAGGELTWGLRSGDEARYGAIQAEQGRRVVVIDYKAGVNIVQRVQQFLAYGFVR